MRSMDVFSRRTSPVIRFILGLLRACPSAPRLGQSSGPRLLPFINQGKPSILQRMFALSNDGATGRSRDRERTAVAPVTTANLGRALLHCNVAYAIQLASAARRHGEPKAGATTIFA